MRGKQVRWTPVAWDNRWSDLLYPLDAPCVLERVRVWSARPPGSPRLGDRGMVRADTEPLQAQTDD
jgi:hypothetical protein